jgi:SAM-dependent methyltransferase
MTDASLLKLERDEDAAGEPEFLERMRPEMAAGGYARDSSEVSYYLRINSLLKPSMTMVDLGAGRGTQLLGPKSFVGDLMKFQGKVKKVIGLDVDGAVADHPYLDEYHVFDPAKPYPLNDSSVDLIAADWVLEHVADPKMAAREIHRVLKPGGWFCARTPNRFGYVALAASLVPNSLHNAVLKRVWPEREVEDVFPTVYALNTRGAISQHFSPDRWLNCSYTINSTPKYHANRALLFNLVGAYQSIMPPPLRTDLHVFLRKRG